MFGKCNRKTNICSKIILYNGNSETEKNWGSTKIDSGVKIICKILQIYVTIIYELSHNAENKRKGECYEINKI